MKLGTESVRSLVGVALVVEFMASSIPSDVALIPFLRDSLRAGAGMASFPPRGILRGIMPATLKNKE
jgi:hypothetical protein